VVSDEGVSERLLLCTKGAMVGRVLLGEDALNLHAKNVKLEKREHPSLCIDTADFLVFAFVHGTRY
jgi:hypothetical protein